MAQEIIKNPGDLDIIDNPNKPSTTMANKTDEAIAKFSEQAKTAAYIIGGQAIAAQANAIVVPGVLKNQSATMQQIVRAGLPLALGVVMAMSTKNEHIRGLSLGFGTQGVLEGIKFLMPNFNPQEGLAEGSSFVFQDEEGEQKQAYVTADGKIIMPNGQIAMLPKAAAAAPKQSQHTSHSEMETGEGQLNDWYDSEYAEADVEYV